MVFMVKNPLVLNTLLMFRNKAHQPNHKIFAQFFKKYYFSFRLAQHIIKKRIHILTILTENARQKHCRSCTHAFVAEATDC